MIDGRASRQELESLWQLLLNELRGKLSALKVSAEMLQVARVFLTNAGYVSPTINSAATSRKLDQLHALYLKGLTAALSDGVPSAGVLSEARLYAEQVRRQQAEARAAAGHHDIPDMPFPR